MIDEEARLFTPVGLVGILTHPRGDVRSEIVLLLNAGMIHHVGPQGLYVQLARRLAKRGFTVLRADTSGLGDSPTRKDAASVLTALREEPRQLMDEVEALTGRARFVVGGICSAAYAAYHCALADERVVGMLMINPQDLVEGSAFKAQVQTRRYLTRSLFKPLAWKHLLIGQSNYRRIWFTLRQQIGRLWRRAPDADAGGDAEHSLPVVRQGLRDIAARGTRPLWVISSEDRSRDLLAPLVSPRLLAAGQEQGHSAVLIPEADHLFTLLRTQDLVQGAIERWLCEQFPASETLADAEREVVEL